MIKLSNYLLLLSIIFVIRVPETCPDYSISFVSEESSIGSKENPLARQVYENQLLANPKTGLIDINRRQELAFARNLPIKEEPHSDLRIEDEEFQKAGPYNIGGRTRAAAFDVRSERTILAGGVSGNIWKTINGGENWTRSSTANIRNSVTTLVQDTRENHQDTWYFGTGELLGNSARSLASPYRGGGIYQSVDNGDTWTILNSTIDEASPDNFTSMFQYVWRMALNPDNLNESEIYAATFGGIVRSDDGGSSWSVVLGEPLFNTEIEDLNCEVAPFYTEIHRTAQGVYFASLSAQTAAARNSSCENDEQYAKAGFYYSLDGINWINITPAFLSEKHQRTIINSNNTGDEVYFLIDGESQAFLKFTVTSKSASVLNGIWNSLPFGIPKLGGTYGNFDSQGGYNMMVSVHPSNDNIIYVGGTNLYRSTDGFVTERNTSWIGGYSPKNNASQYEDHHADQHLLLFYPSNSNQMISCSDGGLIKTNNNLADTVKWTSLNNGYLTSQFYSISQRKDNRSNEIIGGMQDNGSYFRDAVGENPPWNRVLGGDGGYAAITSNSDYRYVSFQNSQVYRTTMTDNYRLSSFARVDPLGGGTEEVPYLFINPFELDPKNDNIMYLLGGNVVWRNNNLAQIPGGIQKPTSVGWDKLTATKIPDILYSCLSVSPSSDKVYAGITSDLPGLVVIDNASDKFNTTVSFHRDSLILPSGGHVSSIAINPEDDNHIVLTISNYNVPSIFESFDGGQTFIDISGNLEEFPNGLGYGPSVRWAEIVPTNNGYRYFVGTSIGLFATDSVDGFNTIWKQNGAEEIGYAVVTMMDYRTIDGRLVIATHGSGTFETFVNDAKKYNLPDFASASFTSKSYPNPFTAESTISYELPEDGEVVIDLFDDSGRLIRNLLFAPQYAGKNQIVWDGLNNAGIPVRSGIYFVVIHYKGKNHTVRIVRLPF